ncbi:MAG: threonine synthase [Chloroflexi bacterium HGW-Chloroflexi-2]|jgi:threonine synthase|nr:MAG: threonine synthase [Chloroflexi bacterium HGW-Chloroflexi-2]
MKKIQLICTECERVYPADQPIWRCTCGGLLDIEMETSFPIEEIQKRPSNMWRYREALPIDQPENIISFSEGFTPIIPVEFGGKMVGIKQDHLFQTGSYKDRGASVLISIAKELGIKHVVEDSSGNAGCAIAAYCARANISCDIYVPANTSPAKLAQITQYGANLHLIPGNREATAHAVLTAARTTYYASHSWNPFFFQGTKTFAYEIWEQNDFQAPQAIVVPAGNGTLVLGAWIGFNDLKKAGIITTIPRIFAVQAKNCAPLYAAHYQHASEPSRINASPTLAEGIAITEPIRGKQILAAIRRSNGTFATVSEEEIQDSIISMHRKGFYIEPTAAATIAAIPKLVQSIPEIDQWISVFTGHGLKSTEKIMSIQEHVSQ